MIRKLLVCLWSDSNQSSRAFLKTILFVLLLIVSLFSFSQKVENVRFEQQGKTIVVYYDLIGNPGVYSVNLFYTHDDGTTWIGPLISVSGDIGENQKPGIGKKISWDVIAEQMQVTGEIYFEVRIKTKYYFTESAKHLDNDKTPVLQNIIIDFDYEMVIVKGGTFQMGSPNNGSADERPVHSITLSDFYIGATEVTQKFWNEIMGNDPSANRNCDSCPVEQVSWEDVQEFIKKLNRKTGKIYRLPTEAEWEYAARGGSNDNGNQFSGSNIIGNVGWYDGNSESRTHAVRQKQPNELGIYDMTGNVWEWCSDWYGIYLSGAQTNPIGSFDGVRRVLRGGSWSYPWNYCRNTYRDSYFIEKSHGAIGFRLVIGR